MKKNVRFLSLIAHFLKKSIAILKKNITFVRKIDWILKNLLLLKLKYQVYEKDFNASCCR